MAYQSFDVLKAMEDDLGSEIRSLKVDGGASANDFLMQFQSDIMGCRVQRPVCIETTALGAAYFAGLAAEYWESLDDIKNNWQTGKEYLPQMEEGEAGIRLLGWHKAVESARISAGSI
jgi:glycerol kinase